MFSFKPKEDIFFKLLIDSAKNAHEATKFFDQLMNHPENSEKLIEQIESIEDLGDSIKHQIEKKLQETFITPFDREDIYLIIKNIDKYLNDIRASALRVNMLHINEIPEHARQISSEFVKSTEQLVILVENLKSKKSIPLVRECIINMNKCESKIDIIFRNAIAELFANPTDLLNLIKWKEMYQHLENTSDQCEEIANSIGSIITKNE